MGRGRFGKSAYRTEKLTLSPGLRSTILYPNSKLLSSGRGISAVRGPRRSLTA
jgi:hypothetical protein